MAKKGGRGKKALNTRPKGKGKAGGKWGHGFKPKNAVARQLKNKTFRNKSTARRRRGSGTNGR